jgi:hypothetical protein
MQEKNFYRDVFLNIQVLPNPLSSFALPGRGRWGENIRLIEMPADGLISWGFLP